MWIPTVLQLEPWPDALARIGELGRSVERGALVLLIALAVLVVGWAIATLLSRLVGAVLRALRFDQGVRGLLGERATARHEPVAVVVWAVYWAIIACSVLLGLEVVGFDLAGSVGGRLGEVVPRIVTSALLFTFGMAVAVLLGSVTRRFLDSAGIRAARLQGQVVSAILTGFAALLALEQLGFAAQFVMAVGIVAAAAAGLGLALAFGLGCRDLARDFVVEYLRSLDEQGPKRPD